MRCGRASGELRLLTALSKGYRLTPEGSGIHTKTGAPQENLFEWKTLALGGAT